MGGRNGLSLRPKRIFPGEPPRGGRRERVALEGGPKGRQKGHAAKGGRGRSKTRARASSQQPRREARNAPHPKGEPGSVVRGRPPYPEAAFQRAEGAWRPEESWFPPLGIP